MTIKNAISETIKRTNLSLLDIELILANILKKSREFIFTHPEYELTDSQITNFKLQISKLKKGLPLAYITGHKEFYGYDFIVDKNVLIPRPETELMVDEALRLITHHSQPATLIDVGTGSGCIIITIIKKSKIKNQKSKIYAIDISKKALLVAKKNAKCHQVSKKIKFFQGNLLKSLINKQKFTIRNSQFVILANLPYLTPKQIKNSPTIKYEPKLALSAGPDGLKYYRQLFKQINQLIFSIHNSQFSILCEIDPSQKNKIKKLINCCLPQAQIEFKKDLKNHTRLVIVKKNAQ